MLKRRYNNTLLLERLNDNLSETDCDVNSAHAPKKTDAVTNIRFNYTTTDAPANAVFTIYAEYRTPPIGGALTVAA